MSNNRRDVAQRSRWERLASWAWPGRPSRWREVPARILPSMSTVFRLTAAAVVAYLVTLVLTDGAVDLTGPLTALLVVQASTVSTLKMGVVRVGAVLCGILVATLVSIWIGLTWWSLGAAIAASLILARVFRLGEQALETPISAMLILGVTDHSVAAETRILNTLIGAGVGIAFNLIYPPAMPTASAGRSLLRVVDAAAAPLEVAADDLVAGPVASHQADSWLDRVRRANRSVAVASDVISSLKDSRRLNPRALGTIDVEPVLASGLDTLEHCLLDIRALFTVIAAEIPDDADQGDDPYGEELRTAFAVVLRDTADCLRAFGSLVVAEAEDREEDAEHALAESLDILRETQAVLTELIMVDARHNPSSWLLRGSVLAAVEQVLTRLDLEERARRHRLWKEEQERRPMAHLHPIIQGVLPHPDRPYLRGFQPEKLRYRRQPEEGP